MIELLVAAALGIGVPVPPEVSAWYRDEAPGVVLHAEDWTERDLTLTAPVRELWVRTAGYDLVTRTVDRPTTIDAALEKGDDYCALVLVDDEPTGDMLCSEWPVGARMWPRELEKTELTSLPADGIFRVDGGLFTIVGDQVLPLDARAKVHVPDGTGNAEQFFRMLVQRDAELEPVARATGAGILDAGYPPLLGPADPGWDALVAKGMTIPEPMHPMEEGPERSDGLFGETPPLVVAWTVIGLATAVVWFGFALRRRRRERRS